MKDNLQVKVNEMLDLYNTISKDFKWQNNLINHFTALTYTIKDANYDKGRIEDVKKHIKDNTGGFSYYRGVKLQLLSMLLCSEFNNPNEEFDNILKLEKLLHDSGFKKSTHLSTAAYIMLNQNETSHKETARIAYDIYVEMKKHHPWITGGDDYPLCILLAESKGSVDIKIDKIEECYRHLNDAGLHKSNGLQLLSHVLSLSNEHLKTKVERCMDIHNRMKENKLKIRPEYYSALGIITLMSEDNNGIIEDFIELSGYLNGIKKYKWLGKGMNAVMASALVSKLYIEENSKDNFSKLLESSISVTVEILIAAQVAAMIGAMAAVSAASSAN